MTKLSIIRLNTILLFFLGITSCSSQTDTGVVVAPPNTNLTTTGILCDLNESGYNASDSVELNYTYAWGCTEDERLLTANGVPNHDAGTVRNDRDTVLEQNVSASFTLMPAATNTATAVGGGRGTIAFALNGVKFDPGTAGTCDDSGDNCSLVGNVGQWNIEALGQNEFSFGIDANNAHVQGLGTYHYHGMPEGLLTELGNGEAMTLIGWAADGFPVYARYGYSDAMDASSSVKVITGSYQLKETPDANRPDTDLYAMGSFSQDYAYVEGSGDLDECNGRVGVTPEFPEGIYHYYVTDSYPFMTRCVKGEVTVNQGPPVNP
ncbi:MAG: YHYH protein [Deinococcota bacterium]